MSDPVMTGTGGARFAGSPMADPGEDWLEGCPARLREPLRRCAEGGTPPNMGLMQLLMEAVDPAEAEAVLVRALAALEGRPGPGEGAGRLRSLADLWRANPQAWTTVKSVLSGVEHDGAALSPDAGLAHWAGVFDRAARISPEGSVALYALGNPDLLDAATAEVVARMEAWGLLGSERDLLDIGCGIGRFEAALAPEVRTIVGIDIAGAMIEMARRRCAGLSNVRLLQSSGRDLSPFEDARFDLVFSVDAFPYLVQAGAALVERHVAEAVRVLKPGGNLLILNFSYGGNAEADRDEVAKLAAAHGLNVVRNGVRAFDLWDGLAFHLMRAV